MSRHTNIKHLLNEITEEEQYVTDNRMRIALKISEALHGYTQEQLKNKLRLNESQISELISGEMNCTIDLLSRIEFELNIKLLNYELSND